jgi:hypothetical protein
MSGISSHYCNTEIEEYCSGVKASLTLKSPMFNVLCKFRGPSTFLLAMRLESDIEVSFVDLRIALISTSMEQIKA